MHGAFGRPRLPQRAGALLFLVSIRVPFTHLIYSLFLEWKRLASGSEKQGPAGIPKHFSVAFPRVCSTDYRCSGPMNRNRKSETGFADVGERWIVGWLSCCNSAGIVVLVFKTPCLRPSTLQPLQGACVSCAKGVRTLSNDTRSSEASTLLK